MNLLVVTYLQTITIFEAKLFTEIALCLGYINNIWHKFHATDKAEPQRLKDRCGVLISAFV